MNKLILSSLALAVSACGADEPGRMPAATDPVEVVVSEAVRAPSSETFPATVVSERSAEVATRMAGVVRTVHVQVGSTVRAGAPLVSLDDVDVEARVGAARAGFDLAERLHGRIQRLAADGAASQQELDGAAASLETARAAVQEAEAQRAYSVVRAPFDGLVTSRSVDPGDLAAPGTPLVTLVSPEALKVVSDLPAVRMGTLAAGDSVQVLLVGVDHPLGARVTRVVDALRGGSRTFRVEAALSEVPVGVVHGAYGRLAIELPEDGARWIPEDALIRRGQLHGVFTVESDTVRLRWVRLGERRGDGVELLSGPMGELAVVRRPAPELIDGAAVSSRSVEAWRPAGREGVR